MWFLCLQTFHTNTVCTNTHTISHTHRQINLPEMSRFEVKPEMSRFEVNNGRFDNASHNPLIELNAQLFGNNCNGGSTLIVCVRIPCISTCGDGTSRHIVCRCSSAISWRRACVWHHETRCAMRNGVIKK